MDAHQRHLRRKDQHAINTVTRAKTVFVIREGDADYDCERLDRYKTEDNLWVAVANYENYRSLLEREEEGE